MRCSQCRHENLSDALFCEECGVQLERICSQCQTTNRATSKFCRKCGTSLASTPAQSQQQPVTKPGPDPSSYTPQHLAEKILTSRSALQGERKQVTVMFADIKDSTELIRDLDPESAQQLLDPAIHIMMDAVHRFEGTVNQVLGDGIMALFGAPVAHEDHAPRACYASLAMQTAMQPYANEVRREHGVEMQIRVGLNSGEVVVRAIGNDLHMDYSAVGPTTHLAARMEQIARPGSIRFPTSTLRLVEGFVQVQTIGPVPVKGMTEPVEVFELTGASAIRRRLQAAVARGLTKFVGRATEIEALAQALERSASGHGQVVAAVGEAGLGKSRLFYEFTQSHRTQGWRAMESASASYGKATPYFPLVGLLKRYAHVEDGDDARTIRAKLTGQVLTLDEALHDITPALLALCDVLPDEHPFLQLDPPQRRQRTLDALKRLLLRESQEQPLTLVFEDLHWIDSETQALLDRLVESLPTSQLLLLVNYRPEYQHAWGSKTYYTQLRLDPLPPESADAFLASVLGDDLSLEPLKALLIERTQGNPFFLEETVRTLVETDVLVGEPGEYRLLSQMPPIQVPDTVQAVLAARMDRLPPDDKQLLQTAAVIGMEVPLALLQAITDLPEDVLHRSLAHLQAAEFVYETQLFPERQYTFKHALTQNVAYDSLLAARKQALHIAAGLALEALYAGRLEEAYDQLAYHYARTNNAIKAVTYLTLVAERAAQGYVHAEAATLWQDAVTHAERLPAKKRDRGVLDGMIRQAQSLFYLGRRQELIDLLLGQQDRLVQLQDPMLAGRYYMQLGFAYAFLGQREQAVQNLQHALAEGMQCGDVTLVGNAHGLLAQEMVFSGAYHQGISHAQQAVSLLEETTERAVLARTLHTLCLLHLSIGDFPRSLAVARRLQTLSDTIGNRGFQANALNAMGMCYTAQDELEAAVKAYQQALASAPDAYTAAWFIGNLGAAYLAKGDLDAAIVTLEQAVEQANQYRSRQVQSWFKIALGEAYRQGGRIDEAYSLSQQVLTLAKDIKFPSGIGFAQRALGRIAHTRGNLDEATTFLHDALATFSAIHGQYETARTHLDLASLAHTQGEQDTTIAQLSTAYAWFKKLQIPKWMERTEQLAREYGVTPTDVQVEPLMEEPS